VCCGSTDGKISAWKIGAEDNSVLLPPTRLVQELKVHLMGVNTLSVSREQDNVLIASGGDDQAIGLVTLDSTYKLLSHRLFPQSCASSIRGVWVGNGIVYSAGINQRLRVWDMKGQSPSLKNDSLVDCADVNSIDVKNGKTLVVGAGLCLFESL